MANARSHSVMAPPSPTSHSETPLEARARELSGLSTHLQNAAEKERSELARNLHDELGGLLTAAKMDLSWLQSRLKEPLLEKRLAELGDALDEAMNVKRRIVEALRPSLLDHFGLATTLRAHAESRCVKASLVLDPVFDDGIDAVPTDVAIALFRLVQEGLTNIITHAGAQRVQLEFCADASSYKLKLSDDGKGFDLADSACHRSHGLVGMRQRIEALNGRFSLRSRPGRGTEIDVEVPREAQARCHSPEETAVNDRRR